MIKLPAKGLAVLATCCATFGIAHATDPLPAQTQVVAASTATPPAASPTQRTFHISPATTPAPDLVVTLTDLYLQTPAGVELTSASVVVSQAGAIAGSATLTAPATAATVSLPAASGDFTIAVFGVPGAASSVGTFSVCVAPKSDPSNCIASQPVAQSPSFVGNISVQTSPTDQTISTLSTSFTVTTRGSYTFTFTDLKFPTQLNTNTTTPNPSVALFQGITPYPPGQTPGITSGTAITLDPGQYTLLSLAQADPAFQQGLYSITVTAPDGVTTPVNIAVPVGLLSPPTRCPNSTAQLVTLTVSDYHFPDPVGLASASALLTTGSTLKPDGTYLPGGTYVGQASSVGVQSFAAPASDLWLFTYGNIGSATAGTFSADVASATADLCTTAQGVVPSPPGTTYAYAFVTPTPLTVGAYQATAADLQFPAQLSGLQFAVAQNGSLKVQKTSAATVNFNAVAGNAVLLVSAQTPSSGNGLFDVNLQSTGASASLVYDKTQIVTSTGGLFSAQTVTVADNASYDATLTDLKFPASFASLGLVVSRGSSVVGKVFGGGKLSFAGTPGDYQLTFVATLSTTPTPELFGLYGSSVVYSPPTITLSSSVTSAAVGATVQLTWSATNASTCSASGGNWTGNKATSTTTESVVLAATTTYALNCTGPGGATTQSVTVTATAAPASTKSGGGVLDLGLLTLCGGLLAARIRKQRNTII